MDQNTGEGIFCILYFGRGHLRNANLSVCTSTRGVVVVVLLSHFSISLHYRYQHYN